MEKTEVKIDGQELYKGKIITLHLDNVLLPNGKSAKREYVSHNGGASILPVDREGNVYLVRQFRYAYGEEILEIPAGKIEIGEDPYSTAIRELKEETGFIVCDLVDYGCIYPTPGYTNEHLYVYLAKVSQMGTTNFDEDEFLDLVKMPICEAFSLVQKGVIKDAKTVYAICRYMAEK